jgi:hypothetical protein
VNTPSPPPNSKPKSYSTQLGILALVVFIIGVTAAITVIRSQPSTNVVNIVNGLATVNAQGYEYYSFYAPSGATNVHVQGSFTASGGSGNDIIVYIMDSTSFVNWENGHQVGVYYNSGQMTTAHFDVPLPSDSGSYYLVYSNKFSLFSQKNVNTQVNLIYTN